MSSGKIMFGKIALASLLFYLLGQSGNYITIFFKETVLASYNFSMLLLHFYEAT